MAIEAMKITIPLMIEEPAEEDPQADEGLERLQQRSDAGHDEDGAGQGVEPPPPG